MIKLYLSVMVMIKNINSFYTMHIGLIITILGFSLPAIAKDMEDFASSSKSSSSLTISPIPVEKPDSETLIHLADLTNTTPETVRRNFSLSVKPAVIQTIDTLSYLINLAIENEASLDTMTIAHLANLTTIKGLTTNPLYIKALLRPPHRLVSEGRFCF